MMKRLLRTLIVFSYFFYTAAGVSIISALTFEAAQASPKDP
jgi:hypothetical protein